MTDDDGLREYRINIVIPDAKIPEGLRFLERLLPGLHGNHLGPEHLHAIHVELLTLAIHRAHVDDTLHPEHGSNRGRGHTVLARAGFGDDARLPHPTGQEDLADAVVDLMRPGVK